MAPSKKHFFLRSSHGAVSSQLLTSARRFHCVQQSTINIRVNKWPHTSRLYTDQAATGPID